MEFDCLGDGFGGRLGGGRGWLVCLWWGGVEVMMMMGRWFGSGRVGLGKGRMRLGLWWWVFGMGCDLWLWVLLV